jgi:putative membrane protein
VARRPSTHERMVNRRGRDGDLPGSELSDSVNEEGTHCHARDVTVYRVVTTGLALWLAAQIIAGIRLADGLDALATIATVLVVALVLCAVQVASRGVRRVIAVIVGVRSLPVTMIAVAAANALLFWLATSLAEAMGLGYTVDGLVPALLGSLLLALVLALAGRHSIAR